MLWRSLPRTDSAPVILRGGARRSLRSASPSPLRNGTSSPQRQAMEVATGLIAVGFVILFFSFPLGFHSSGVFSKFLRVLKIIPQGLLYLLFHWFWVCSEIVLDPDLLHFLVFYWFIVHGLQSWVFLRLWPFPKHMQHMPHLGTQKTCYNLWPHIWQKDQKGRYTVYPIIPNLINAHKPPLRVVLIWACN